MYAASCSKERSSSSSSGSISSSNSSSTTVISVALASESQAWTVSGLASSIASGPRSGKTEEKQRASRVRTSAMRGVDSGNALDVVVQPDADGVESRSADPNRPGVCGNLHELAQKVAERPV